jgi:hypothetical protein
VRLIGRLSILVILVAVAAWGAWFVLLQRQDVQLDLFERDARARWEVAAPKPAAAEAFRATVCAASPCVLVEAGGLSFLVGAGEGAAQGLAELGLMRANLDAVLLTDLQLGSIEDLSELQRAGSARGRSEPTSVFGPEGVLAIVDGANLLLAGSGEGVGRLQVGVEGEDQGLEGKVVLDTGVVTVRAFATTGAANARLYRFDSAGKSVVVAGCSARPADVLAATRGTKTAAAVLAARSDRMLIIEQKAAAGAGATQPTAPICMSSEEAVQVIQDARLAGGLLAPLIPAPVNAPASRAWKEVAAIPVGLSIAPGEPGASLELSDEVPKLDLPK